MIDFRPRGSEGASTTGRDDGDQHGVNPETVSRELVQAGFTLVSSEIARTGGLSWLWRRQSGKPVPSAPRM